MVIVDGLSYRCPIHPPTTNPINNKMQMQTATVILKEWFCAGFVVSIVKLASQQTSLLHLVSAVGQSFPAWTATKLLTA
jgi:hypothetical protein